MLLAQLVVVNYIFVVNFVSGLSIYQSIHNTLLL